MVLIVHPAVANNIDPPLRHSSNDPVRAQALHAAVVRGPHTTGAKDQQSRALIGIKSRLGDPLNSETIPQCPATGRENLQGRARTGWVSESVGMVPYA